MFLHIGGGKFLRSDDIVGFFDIETATQTASTKDFLKMAEDRGETEAVCSDLPKSLILTAKRGAVKKTKLYISASAVKTLENRSTIDKHITTETIATEG